MMFNNSSGDGGEGSAPGGVTSTFCTGGNCLEAVVAADEVLIRDTKQGHVVDQPTLTVSLPQWFSFLDKIDGREFSPAHDELIAEDDTDGGFTLQARSNPDVVLSFDRSEALAFRQGVAAGEFREPVLVAAG